MFAAATFYSQTNKPGWDGTAYLFVGLAFAAFICIVLFHVYLILRETAAAVWKKMPKLNTDLKEKDKELQPFDNDRDIPRPRVGATPTQTTVSLREPLLEQ